MDRFHTSEHIGGVTSISAWISPRRLGLCYAARQNYSADLPLAHLQNTTEKSHVEAQSAICTCATMLHAPGLKRLSHGRRFQRFLCLYSSDPLVHVSLWCRSHIPPPTVGVAKPILQVSRNLPAPLAQIFGCGENAWYFSYTNVGLPVIFSG